MGQHDDIKIQADESGEIALAITWEQRHVAATVLTDPGVYCLRNNVLDWDEERFWRTYIMLTDLEAVFSNPNSTCARCITTPKSVSTDICSSPC